MAENGNAPLPLEVPGLQSSVPLPPKLEMRGNIAQNWKRWKQIWDSFEIVTNLKQKDQAYRVATFITCIGVDALEVYNGLPFSDLNEQNNMDIVLKLMETHCLGETNVIYERYIFNNRVQQDKESIETYATQLRALSQTCDYGDLQDQLIRDRIVCGIRENSIRKKLLQEADLTLKRCIDICRAAESTTAQVKAIAGQDMDNDVHAVSGSSSRSKYHKKTSSARYSRQNK